MAAGYVISKVKLKKGGRTLGMGGDVTVSELLGLSYIDYRRMMRILFLCC